MTTIFQARIARAHKSRTVWFGILIAVMSVLQGFVFELPVEPIYQALIGCAIGIGVVLLRYYTTGGLEDA